MSAMLDQRIPAPVQWAEGMLLAPQHFQQNQIYYEKLLQHHLRQCQPFYWGIYDLEVDHSRLMTGVVVIKRIHAVMPDGLVVQYDSSALIKGQSRLIYDINKDDEHKNQTSDLFVYLAVPVRGPGATSSNTSIRRFDSWEQENVSDENTGEGRLGVYRLLPKLELKVGEAVDGNYSSIPLFKLEKDGMYKVQPFYPPQLAVRTLPFLGIHSLGTLVQKTLVQLRKVATHLMDICSADNNNESSSALGQAQRHTIACLTSALFKAEVLLYSEASHPFELYQAVADIVGRAAPIGRNLVPNRLPDYNHNDCLEGFSQALAFINQTMNSIQLAYSTVKFQRKQAGIFEIRVDKSWRQEKLLVELKPRDGVSEESLEVWMKHAHIASAALQKHLQKSRTIGCESYRVESDDEIGVVANSGCALFKIERDETLVISEQLLQIVCVDSEVAAYEPESIVLYIPHQENMMAKAADKNAVRSQKPRGRA